MNEQDRVHDGDDKSTHIMIDAERRVDRWRLTGRLTTMVAPFNAGRYADAVTSSIARGHGVLAEKANHIVDRLSGASAQHVGADNVRNGADRIVDGILIQTKYCSSGSKCVSSCFGPDGFRYMAEGSPMQVEVPRDLHADALKAMRVRISRGEIPGVTDPAEADRIIRPGHLTYEQAVNLGKAGTIESITYDVATGTVFAGCAFGLSAAARFAQGVWHGEDVAQASIAAIEAGVAIGGLSFVTSIVGNQLARTAFDQALRPVGHVLVDGMTSQMVRELAAAFGREGLRGAAAETFVAKALRGNLVGLIATNGVMAGVDAWRFATGRMTATQAARSLAVRSGGGITGSAGWMMGAAKGAAIGSIVPGLGTGVGALVGGLAASVLAGTYGTRFTDQAIERATITDIERAQAYGMLAYAEEVEAHMMADAEAQAFMDEIAGLHLEDIVPFILKAPQPKAVVRELIAPAALRISSRRRRIVLPSGISLEAVAA